MSLPPGWREVPLKDLCVPVPNIDPTHTPLKEFEYVDIGAVDNVSGQITQTKRFLGRDAPSRARRPMRCDDVLFSNVRTYLRNVARATHGVTANVCSTGFTVLRPGELLDSAYLYHYVRSDAFIASVTPEQTGTHYPATSDRVVLSQLIPVPSTIQEQAAIAKKLDHIATCLDVTRARLNSVQATLKRVRMSVIAAACSGRLTAGWKGGHSAIGWKPMSLGELASHITSGSRGWAKNYAQSGALFIRAQNINTNRLVLDDIAYVRVPPSTEGARTRVAKSDLLITITGANVAKTALVESNLNEAYVSQHVGLVRLRDISLAPFVYLWLSEGAPGRTQLMECAYGAGKPGLNLDNIRNVRISLPSIREQAEITRRVQALFHQVDTIETRYKKARTFINKLMSATLANAFRGEMLNTHTPRERGCNGQLRPEQGYPEGTSLDSAGLQVLSRM